MSIAVIRNMDTQGRIIIPADIRKETGIRRRQHPGDCHGRDNDPHPEVYAPEYRFQRTPGFPGASL